MPIKKKKSLRNFFRGKRGWGEGKNDAAAGIKRGLSKLGLQQALPDL